MTPLQLLFTQRWKPNKVEKAIGCFDTLAFLDSPTCWTKVLIVPCFYPFKIFKFQSRSITTSNVILHYFFAYTFCNRKPMPFHFALFHSYHIVIKIIWIKQLWYSRVTSKVVKINNRKMEMPNTLQSSYLCKNLPPPQPSIYIQISTPSMASRCRDLNLNLSDSTQCHDHQSQ